LNGAISDAKAGDAIIGDSLTTVDMVNKAVEIFEECKKA